MTVNKYHKRETPPWRRRRTGDTIPGVVLGSKGSETKSKSANNGC